MKTIIDEKFDSDVKFCKTLNGTFEDCPTKELVNLGDSLKLFVMTTHKDSIGRVPIKDAYFEVQKEDGTPIQYQAIQCYLLFDCEMFFEIDPDYQYGLVNFTFYRLVRIDSEKHLAYHVGEKRIKNNYQSLMLLSSTNMSAA